MAADKDLVEDRNPQSIEDLLSRVGSIDVVIGIVAPLPPEELNPWLAAVKAALAALANRVRAAVVVPGSQGISPAPATEHEGSDIVVLSHPLIEPEALSHSNPARHSWEVYRALFALSQNLGARACGVFASGLDPGSSRWIYRLLRPVLELDFDLVTPSYDRPKFEGLLNSSILSPMTRALYGKRILNPLGPDLGCSARLVASLLVPPQGAKTPQAEMVTPLVTPAAVRNGYEICQACVGPRIHPPSESADLSSLLVQTLGPLFLDVESNAAFWQKIRGSEPIPIFGSREPVEGETSGVDLNRLIESFQLGWRSLREVWAIALPPATLFELGKLARLPREQFRMPDELWVRIVYDFALAYRLGQISRDHLLRSMTPLYLAWVASYAREMESADTPEVDRRLEQLASAYETGKPYLFSRWRWPDRFNP